MMTKKLLVVMAMVGAISLLLAACFVDYDPTDIPQGEPIADSSGKTISGTSKSTEQGWSGPIEVTVTVKDGYITEVTINGSGSGDATSLGSEIIKRAPEMVRKANSFDIDALASASPAILTKGAIKKAGNAALTKITNGEDGK
jgi:uncharacterized protein with FMN-binding domain